MASRRRKEKQQKKAQGRADARRKDDARKKDKKKKRKTKKQPSHPLATEFTETLSSSTEAIRCTLLASLAAAHQICLAQLSAAQASSSTLLTTAAKARVRFPDMGNYEATVAEFGAWVKEKEKTLAGLKTEWEKLGQLAMEKLDEALRIEVEINQEGGDEESAGDKLENVKKFWTRKMENSESKIDAELAKVDDFLHGDTN